MCDFHFYSLLVNFLAGNRNYLGNVKSTEICAIFIYKFLNYNE